MFLSGYLETAGRASFLPESLDDLRVLLDFICSKEASGSSATSSRQRRDWVRIRYMGSWKSWISGSRGPAAESKPLRLVARELSAACRCL